LLTNNEVVDTNIAFNWIIQYETPEIQIID